MTAALVFLAIMAPLMVGGAFYVGLTAGVRLSRGLSPAGAVAEVAAEVKATVQSVTQSGTSVVPTEVDEWEAERQRTNERIAKALTGYGVGEG